MSKRENILLVEDMLVSLKRILEYTSGMTYDDFLNNQLVKDAVVRNFEIVGEAANMLSSDFRQQNSNVDWRSLVDFRNKLIHHYFGVYYEIVWEVIAHEVSDYVELLEMIEKDSDEN